MEEAWRDPRLNEELTRAVRRWARPTTPDELSARGVRRVHALRLSHVASLLEKAVNRTLIRRTLEGATDDTLSLSTAAREEFVRLAWGAERDGEGAAAREVDGIKQRATSTLERLREELGRRRVALARDAKVHHTLHDLREADAAVERVRELFARFGGDRDVPRALEHEVLSVVRKAFDDVAARERIARQRDHRREIGQLERRITKLQTLLAETEAELARTRAAKGVEHGIASLYDSVQGLAFDDPLLERKSVLMGAIFEANLALRR